MLQIYTVKYKIIQCDSGNKSKTEIRLSEHINEKGDGPYRGFGYLKPLSHWNATTGD